MNTSPDPKKLAKLTRAAIKRGNEEKARIEAQKAAAEVRQRAKEQAKAHSVIEQIPERAEKEASQGRNHAVIYGMKHNEDYTMDYSLGYNHLQLPSIVERLKGTAKLVWDYCVKAGLKPTVQDWHDGVGVDGGYNIVIHWEVGEEDPQEPDAPYELGKQFAEGGYSPNPFPPRSNDYKEFERGYRENRGL